MDHGEFAVYSTGLLSTSLLIILTDYGEQPFPDKKFWAMVVVGFTIVASLIFGTVTASGLDADLQERINLGLIRVLSVGLYSMTIVVSLAVVVLDKVMPGMPAVEAIRTDDRADLARQFEELDDGND